MSTVKKTESSIISRLFSVGAHFGFRKSRRHPTVSQYIFATKNGNDIIDLERTSLLLERANEVLKEAGTHGKTVIFVSTKDETSRLVRQAAEKISLPYVTNRWIGGMLTNFTEIKKRMNRLEALLHERESGELDRKYTKKERVVLGREIDKLSFNFSGIASLQKLPDIMVVVDPRHDKIAVAEAVSKNIPVIAIMGSDCDASKITYPIVANDTLQGSVTTILEELTAAYEAGKTAYVPKVEARPVRTRA